MWIIIALGRTIQQYFIGLLLKVRLKVALCFSWMRPVNGQKSQKTTVADEGVRSAPFFLRCISEKLFPLLFMPASKQKTLN